MAPRRKFSVWPAVGIALVSRALPGCEDTPRRSAPAGGDAALAADAADEPPDAAPADDAAPAASDAAPDCVPRPETCDGTDEDCDGEIDEAPIISPLESLTAPNGGKPTDLAWNGETWMLVRSGYPNWLIALSFPGVTVWGSARFGGAAAETHAAIHRLGLALTWVMPNGHQRYALLDEVGDDVLPEQDLSLAPPEAEPGTPSIAIVGERAGLMWIDARDGAVRPRWARLDAATGALAGEVATLWPEGLPDDAVAADPLVGPYGTDAFVTAWRVDGTRVGFARIKLGGQLEEGPALVPGLEAVGAFGIAGNPYTHQILIASTGPDGLVARRFDERLALERDRLVLDPATEVTDLRVVRYENVFGVFWRTGPGPQPVQAALIGDDGHLNLPATPLTPPTSDFVVAHGEPGWGLVVPLEEGAKMGLVAGPLVCPTFP